MKDQPDNTPTLPLSMVTPNEHVRVIGIAAGRRASRRLSDLGLIPNTELNVVQNQGQGPLILAVSDTRIAIERGIAHKVLVQPITQPQRQDNLQQSNASAKKSLFPATNTGNGPIKQELSTLTEREVSSCNV